MWQARQVAAALAQNQWPVELVPVKSPADLDLKTPLHQFGETGIFTKMLDVALWEDQIDLAVHSLKDYPTTLPEELQLSAVLPRGPYRDVLIPGKAFTPDFWQNPPREATVATGSIRRIAQWKHRFPSHQMAPLRGNVQTRLRKLKESSWHGAVFAQAGLQRVALLPDSHQILDWMIPAPAQGVVGIVNRRQDKALSEALAAIDHRETGLRSQAERTFLNRVEGGCSAPVGALAVRQGKKLYLEAAVFDLDGSKRFNAQGEAPLEDAVSLGENLARQVLEQGAWAVMEKIKNNAS